jgi:hypothetical protein
MTTRHSFRWFWLALTAAALAYLIIAQTAKTQSTTNANAKTSGGLTVATFEVNPGAIRVYLPDDMAAGDTISGTVIAEPKGQTPEERSKNETQLQRYVVTISYRDWTPASKTPPIAIFDLSKTLATPNTPPLVNLTFKLPQRINLGLFQMPNETAPAAGDTVFPDCVKVSCIPVDQIVLDLPLILAESPDLDARLLPSNPKPTEPTDPTDPTRPLIVPLSELTLPFTIPSLGQTGRPIAITGPFDGNSSNTTLNGTTVKSTVQDFEKGTENVSGGFGLIRPLAESPRKAVFKVPTNVTGPIELNLKERDVETKGTFRNVGVNLSAPKTDLLKGEQTSLRVEVSGLEGIKYAVPLTLTYEGVITMEGGPYQPLRIRPSQVGADGRYSTTRKITGLQAGGWGATATVVTRPFDTCLQDDSVPVRRVLWNTFTGDYSFGCPGCLPPRTQPVGTAGPAGTSGGTGGTKTGETAQTGGTTSVAPNPPPGDNVGPPLTGTGTMARKGCIITLTHNAPDRRVFARLDACTNSASSSVETPPTNMKFSITDKNTTDNTCSSK